MATITIQTDDNLTLNKRLAQARRTAELSQAELGERIGRTFVTVSNIESGTVKSPAFDVIVKWATVTGYPLEYFATAIDGYEPPPSSDPNDRQGFANRSRKVLPFPGQVEIDLTDDNIRPFRHHQPAPLVPAA